MALPHFGISYCETCRKNNIHTQGWKYQNDYYCEKHLKKIQRLDKLKKIKEIK